MRLLTAEERISFLRGEVEAKTISMFFNWGARESSMMGQREWKEEEEEVSEEREKKEKRIDLASFNSAH